VDPTRGADVMPVRIQSPPKGIRPRDAPLPKGLDGRNVVAVLTGSNCQVASRIWLDAGRELALRVIFDTGSGVSLVREALLPPEMKVAPLDAATAQLFDVNGGLLPIKGTVTLTVRIGTYSTQVTCGVVRGMSVPLLLGTDYTDVHVPNICEPKGYIQVLDGCKVPILRRGKTVSYAKAKQPSKAGAASEADTKVRLAREVVLPPRSEGYVPVQTSFQGNGVITQRHRVYERHRVHVATGTMDCTAHQTWWVEVTHTGSTSKRLPKGMVLGHMSAYSGTVAALSREEWASLSPSPATGPDVTDRVEEPHVHTSNVPEGSRPQVLSLLEKHRALWSGHLGSIKAVAVGTLGWRTCLGGGVPGWQIGCDGGWTAFVGPTLASPRGRIGAVMLPSDWATCAWISWPLLVAVVGLDFSLIVFRIVWRDLIFAVRVTCIGRLRLEAEPRAPAGRLLPHISAGWDRIAAIQRRRLVCPLGAGVLACVGPLWPR